MGAIEHPEEWTVKHVFYAFDIPVPTSAPVQLQHCLRSIHTTAVGVKRHRLTTEDSRVPWEFRMTIYVFPASVEECCLTNWPTNMAYDPSLAAEEGGPYTSTGG